MNRNKEYRLKRKAQRKDYIIQDKNLTIKTLYYRNETKRNKIEQLEQKNKQLQNNWNELKEFVEEEIKHLEKSRYVSFNEYGENKLRIFKDFQFKMQELQGDDKNDSKRDVK